MNKNTITVARDLAAKLTTQEGRPFFVVEYVGNRRVINDHGVKARFDARDGREFYAYVIASPSRVYVFRNRAEQCDWLRGNLATA